MSVQEFKVVGSRKVRENSTMSSKSKKEAKRRNVMAELLKKHGGVVSPIALDKTIVDVDTNDFDTVISNLKFADAAGKNELAKQAEEMVENKKREYDKILSNASLTTEERDEIKKKRNKLIAQMQEKLDECLTVKNNEESIQDEGFEIEPELKEEEVSMRFENNGSDELINIQSYGDYIYGEVLKRKATLSTADFDNFIKLVIEYYENGSKIIGVLTREEFIDERRKAIEKIEQRRIEDERRKLEGELIDSNSELGASRERIEMLEKQNGDYKAKLGDLRRENNSLEQKVSQQSNAISELTGRNNDLGNQVEEDRRNISEQQRQIFELQRQLDREVSAREQEGKRIQELEVELSDSKNREVAAEARIKELNESTKKWRDNLSNELRKLSPSDEQEVSNLDNSEIESQPAEVSQEEIDLDKLRQSLSDLTNAINENSFDNPEPQGIQIR